jgi:hypothetical protein
LEVSNDGKIGVIAEGDDLLVNHKSEDTHHGGTAVVELDGTLLKLGLLIEGVPAEVNVSVTEVTDVLVASSGNITHEGALKNSNEGDDLNKAGGGDGVGAEEGGNTVGERVEGVSGIVDASGKVDSSAGHNLSKEGKLSDTSVLDLNITEAVETLLGAVSREHTEGIEESKRGLGTKLVLESTEGGGGLAGLGRGKGGSAGDERGNDGRLHGCCSFGIVREERDLREMQPVNLLRVQRRTKHVVFPPYLGRCVFKFEIFL